MIKCPSCEGPMGISAKGGLSCPVCSNIEKSITVTRKEYGELVYYKVIQRENIDTQNILVEEDIQEILKKGVKVISKEDE